MYRLQQWFNTTRQSIMGISLLVMISGCSTLFNMADDNTPKPSELVNFTPTVAVETVWSRSTGGFNKNDLLLHIATNQTGLFTSSASGTVTAFDQETGNRLWSRNANMKVTGGPGANNRLVVVAGNDGQVIAYNANNGELAWQAQASNQVLAPPAVTNSIVIVKAIDGHVNAFAAANGKQSWEYANPTPALTLRGDSKPTIASGGVIVGFADGKLMAFSLTSGQLLWQHVVSLPEGSTPLAQLVDIDGTPIVKDGMVYVVNYQGNVEAISLRDGQTRWQHKLSSYTGLAVDDAHVYVTDAEGDVWAFDRYTGAVDWRQQKLQARVLTAPAVMGRFVVVADAQGYVHWLNKYTGQFAARVQQGGVIKSPPVVQDNTLYVLTVSGGLKAYRLQ